MGSLLHGKYTIWVSRFFTLSNESLRHPPYKMLETNKPIIQVQYYQCGSHTSVQSSIKTLSDAQQETLANFGQNSREGQECESTSECASHDINLICRYVSSSWDSTLQFLQRTHSNGTGSCVCRRDMRWNPLALECQLFLDLDCSFTTLRLTYSSSVHPQVAAAATQLWHKQHGWTDEEDKKRKILALPRYFS